MNTEKFTANGRDFLIEVIKGDKSNLLVVYETLPPAKKIAIYRGYYSVDSDTYGIFTDAKEWIKSYIMSGV